jgi:hypothetical protein
MKSVLLEKNDISFQEMAQYRAASWYNSASDAENI